MIEKIILKLIIHAIEILKKLAGVKVNQMTTTE